MPFKAEFLFYISNHVIFKFQEHPKPHSASCSTHLIIAHSKASESYPNPFYILSILSDIPRKFFCTTLKWISTALNTLPTFLRCLVKCLTWVSYSTKLYIVHLNNIMKGGCLYVKKNICCDQTIVVRASCWSMHVVPLLH